MTVLRVLIRWAAISLVLATVLFIAAGTTQIPSLRDYIAVFSALLLFTMVSVDPDLAKERAYPGDADADPRTRSVAGFFFLVTVGFGALDVGRLHQSDSVPSSLHLPALLVLAAALGLQAWAMMVNPFFSPALRIQAERDHSLTTCGPYRFVRHPGYLAMLIAIPASALAIGSWLALIPAAGFCRVIVWRARKEEEFLETNLAGYRDYLEQVPGWFFPRLNGTRATPAVISVLPLPRKPSGPGIR